MERFFYTIIRFVGLASVLVAAVAAAQTTDVRDVPASLSPGLPRRSTEIRQQFLTRQQAALAREFRAAQRCVNSARQRLRDVRGNINRTAQIDLQNCGNRLVRLQRESRKLERKGERLARDIDNQLFILEGLIKLFQTKQALAGGS